MAIMLRAGRMMMGLVANTATMVSMAAPPPLPAGPALAPRTHGFMLYISQPLGGGGVGAGATGLKLGLRIQQVRLTGNSGAPDAGDPMQQRELVGWQMEGLRHFSFSGMKIELGNHVTYDVTHGAFGPIRWLGNTVPRQTSTMSRMGEHAGPPVADLLEERSGVMRNFAPHFVSESGGASHEGYRDFAAAASTTNVRDVAASAVAALKLSRASPVQRPGPNVPRPLTLP